MTLSPASYLNRIDALSALGDNRLSAAIRLYAELEAVDVQDALVWRSMGIELHVCKHQLVKGCAVADLGDSCHDRADRLRARAAAHAALESLRNLPDFVQVSS